MDPVAHWILRAGLAALLATAAFHKARAPRVFLQAFRDYRLVPDVLAPAAVAVVVALEAALALALSWPGPARLAALAGLGCGALLAVYSAAIAANLARGRRFIDCGCLGPGAGQPLSAWLLVRNGALVLASALVALPPAARPFGWVDAVSIAGGLGVASLLFYSTNLLAAQAAGARRLRRST